MYAKLKSCRIGNGNLIYLIVVNLESELGTCFILASCPLVYFHGSNDVGLLSCTTRKH